LRQFVSFSANNQKIGIITQARVGSSRLPAKTLKLINGIPLLEYHLERLKKANVEIFLATTFEQDALKLIDIASRLGIKSTQGSTDDVLDRYHHCAKTFDLDVVVRVTSDCPLIDGDLISQGLIQFLALPNWQDSYLSNTQSRIFPRGFDFEIFSFHSLDQAHQHAKTVSEREHVTPYLYQSGKFQIVDFQTISDGRDRSGYRVTVDTPDDLELVKVLIENHHASGLGVAEICEILDRNPQIRKINENVIQKKI
jgi:spore coat polysaccharide biosynthesis protein SpsF